MRTRLETRNATFLDVDFDAVPLFYCTVKAGLYLLAKVRTHSYAALRFTVTVGSSHQQNGLFRNRRSLNRKSESLTKIISSDAASIRPSDTIEASMILAGQLIVPALRRATKVRNQALSRAIIECWKVDGDGVLGCRPFLEFCGPRASGPYFFSERRTVSSEYESTFISNVAVTASAIPLHSNHHRAYLLNR
jgi:hypothetical protein